MSKSNEHAGDGIDQPKNSAAEIDPSVYMCDEKPAAALKLDRAGWSRVLDRMMNWGAHIPADRKDDLIEYLLKGF